MWWLALGGFVHPYWTLFTSPCSSSWPWKVSLNQHSMSHPVNHPLHPSYKSACWRLIQIWGSHFETHTPISTQCEQTTESFDPLYGVKPRLLQVEAVVSLINNKNNILAGWYLWWPDKNSWTILLNVPSTTQSCCISGRRDIELELVCLQISYQDLLKPHYEEVSPQISDTQHVEVTKSCYLMLYDKAFTPASSAVPL